MRQEDLNDMMRYPGERKPKATPHWERCPKCSEKYSGDGVTLCVECQAAPDRKDVAK